LPFRPHPTVYRDVLAFGRLRLRRLLLAGEGQPIDGLEPDSNEILVQSLDVLLAAKDWPALVKTIEALEKSGDYDFKGHLEGEPWAEFRKQPAAKPWL